jgi:micrococcal nuclease
MIFSSRKCQLRNMIKGTHLDVRFSRVVDGDTIRVFLPGAQNEESLRILALDTEESYSFGSKPVTPWGKEAKKRAQEFFQGADTVTIEFPGNESLEMALQKHRGNFGRLLVYVYRDGVDFQRTMIREGYSPYFVKYGNAQFAGHHERYVESEREAQRRRLGVWDQTTVNGVEIRNYAALGTWWQLRASIIDEYRKLKAVDASVLNTRLDYAILEAKAQAGESATVFTELYSLSRTGGRHGLIDIGSDQQPFKLFLPDIDAPAGEEIADLLGTRYFSHGEGRPRRSYAYVTGRLSTFRGRPQMVVTSADQITDRIVARDDVQPSGALAIASLLPDPVGSDRGLEAVTLRNLGTATANLQGWILQDRAGNRLSLEGSVAAGEDHEISLPAGKLPLNNRGDEILLLDPDGRVQSKVAYSASDVVAGQTIEFL